MITAHVSTVLALIITAASVVTAAASFLCITVALVLWAPHGAGFPSTWVRWAILWAAGYFATRVVFWALGWVPVRTPREGEQARRRGRR